MSFYYMSYDPQDADFVQNALLPELHISGFSEWKRRCDVINDPTMTKGINSAINRCYGVILILSKTSMSCEDIKYEWGYAHYIGKPIIPIMIDAPEIIGTDGKLQVIYDVHEKLARQRWYNFSDCLYYEWDSLKHALYSLDRLYQTPHTTQLPLELNM